MANTYTSLYYHHALVMAPATFSPSKIVQLLKGDSSLWIHTEFPTLRDFAWQDGYGAFTVSKSAVSDVISYIQIQRQHHGKKTFQEELRFQPSLRDSTRPWPRYRR